MGEAGLRRDVAERAVALHQLRDRPVQAEAAQPVPDRLAVVVAENPGKVGRVHVHDRGDLRDRERPEEALQEELVDRAQPRRRLPVAVRVRDAPGRRREELEAEPLDRDPPQVVGRAQLQRDLARDRGERSAAEPPHALEELLARLPQLGLRVELEREEADAGREAVHVREARGHDVDAAARERHRQVALELLLHAAREDEADERQLVVMPVGTVGRLVGHVRDEQAWDLQDRRRTRKGLHSRSDVESGSAVGTFDL
jgi:hypothetical protein